MASGDEGGANLAKGYVHYVTIYVGFMSSFVWWFLASSSRP